MTDVLVRLAVDAGDRDTAFRIRYDAYVRELGLFADIADHERRRLTDEHDARASVLLASVDGEPVGTIRLVTGADALHPEFEDNYAISRWSPTVVPPERVMICSKFAVQQEQRRGLVPWALIEAVVRRGLTQGIELVFCDCQPHLVSLYTSLGFRPYRAAYRDPDIAATVPLVLVVNDVDHLRTIASPLLDVGLDGLTPTSTTHRALRRLAADDGGLSLVADPATLPVAQIRSLSVFHGLSDAECEAVVRRGQVLTLGAGDELIRRGHGTHTMYVVVQGRFRTMGETGAATFVPGDPIGEVAFLSRGTRTAGVVADSTPAQALALSDTTLTDLVAEHGTVAAKLLHNLARILATRFASAAAPRPDAVAEGVPARSAG